MTQRILLLLAQLALLLSCCLTAAAHLQARDHLTPKEIDLVKDTQELDKRIDVFIKAANRRLLVIRGLSAADSKDLKTDAELWGDLPTGTRSDLVGDIAKILDEAITNIDDISSRDAKNPAPARALRKLAAAASRIIEQLKPLQSSAADDAEAGNFDQLIDNAETIIQASSKLSPEVAQPPKSKGGKAKTN